MAGIFPNSLQELTSVILTRTCIKYNDHYFIEEETGMKSLSSLPGFL